MRLKGFSVRLRFTGSWITKHCSEVFLRYCDAVAGCTHNVEEDRTSHDCYSGCGHSVRQRSFRPGSASSSIRYFFPMPRARQPGYAPLDSTKFRPGLKSLLSQCRHKQRFRAICVRSFCIDSSNGYPTSYYENTFSNSLGQLPRMTIRRGRLITGV